MILVKSLIVLLLIVLAYYLYDHLYLLKKFDGREGFASASEAAGTSEAGTSEAGTSAAGTSAAGTSASAAGAAGAATVGAPAELKYTVPSPLNKQKNLASDAEMMSNLQDKMNELLKLKEEAIEINNNLKK